MAAVIRRACSACSGVMGRILHTIGPKNGPACFVGMLVLNMGTLQPCSMWRTGMPAESSASSKEKEQPSRKPTYPGCHRSETSVRSSVNTPSRYTR